MKTIDEKVFKGSQSINYIFIAEITNQFDVKRTIEVSIKKDSIPSQSYARLKVWTGTEWSMVNFIHHTKMSTTISPYNAVYSVSDFHTDRNNLIEIANQIL